MFGHLTGDAVLSEVAARLRGAVRDGDTVARWGGEEFIVLAPALDGSRELLEIAERLRGCVSGLPVRHAERTVQVTTSTGAVLVDPQCSADLLVDRADRALYSAKRQGRDRVRLFTDLTPEDVAMEVPEAIRIAEALSLTASVHEDVAERHCEQVAELAGALARVLRLAPDVELRCRLGGWLHDIGKVAIPDRILLKPGPLNDDEWREMRTHVEIGERIIRQIGSVSLAAAAVRHHHERFDGAGYPDGLSGEEIPIEARVVAVSDAFSAITSERVFAPARSLGDALEELRRGAGRQHDPRVVAALEDALTVRRSDAAQRLHARAA